MVKLPLLAVLLLPTGARAFALPPIVATLQDLETAKEKTAGLCKGFGLYDEVAAIAGYAGCSLSGSEPACPGIAPDKVNYLVGKQGRLKELAQIGDAARAGWGQACPADVNRARVAEMRAQLAAARGIPQSFLDAFEAAATVAIANDKDIKMPSMAARADINEYYGGKLSRVVGAFDNAYSLYRNIEKTEAAVRAKLEFDLAQAQTLIAALSSEAAKALSPALKAAAAGCVLGGPKPDCAKVISPALGKQSALVPDLIASANLAKSHRGLTPDAFVKDSVLNQAAAKAAFGGEYYRIETIVVSLETYQPAAPSAAAYTAADGAVAAFKQNQATTSAAKQRSDGMKADLQRRMDAIVTSADRSVIGAGELKPVAAEIAQAKPGLTCPNNRCDAVWEAAIAQAGKQLDTVRAQLDSLATAFRALRAKADALTQKAGSLTPDKKSAVAERVADFKTALADATLNQGNVRYDALAAYAAQQGVH